MSDDREEVDDRSRPIARGDPLQSRNMRERRARHGHHDHVPVQLHRQSESQPGWCCLGLFHRRGSNGHHTFRTGTTVQATQGTTLNVPFLPSTVFPNNYFAATFDLSLTGPWTLTATDAAGPVPVQTNAIPNPKVIPLVNLQGEPLRDLHGRVLDLGAVYPSLARLWNRRAHGSGTAPPYLAAVVG